MQWRVFKQWKSSDTCFIKLLQIQKSKKQCVFRPWNHKNHLTHTTIQCNQFYSNVTWWITTDLLRLIYSQYKYSCFWSLRGLSNNICQDTASWRPMICWQDRLPKASTDVIEKADKKATRSIVCNKSCRGLFEHVSWTVLLKHCPNMKSSIGFRIMRQGWGKCSAIL